MNLKQKIKVIVLGLILSFGVIALGTGTVLAVEKCGGVDTAIVSCTQTGGDGAGVENTGLWGVLILAINVLTGLVAVAALGGIVYGSILYTAAGGNMEQTKKAMGIIMNVVIGIIAYGLMYVGLNFLIPGGVFS